MHNNMALRNLESSSAGSGTGDGGRTSLHIPITIHTHSFEIADQCNDLCAFTATGLVVLVRREWAILSAPALINTGITNSGSRVHLYMVALHDADYFHNFQIGLKKETTSVGQKAVVQWYTKFWAEIYSWIYPDLFVQTCTEVADIIQKLSTTDST